MGRCVALFLGLVVRLRALAFQTKMARLPLKVLREAAKLTSGKYSTCNFYLKEELRLFGF